MLVTSKHQAIPTNRSNKTDLKVVYLEHGKI